MLIGSRSDVDFVPSGRPTLKGFAEPVPLHEVAVGAARATPHRVASSSPTTPRLIRSGIVRLLADEGFDVVGEAGDAEELLALVDRVRPDLVITDIRMPPTQTDEGLRAAATIRAEHPDVAVLVLSQHVEARAAAGPARRPRRRCRLSAEGARRRARRVRRRVPHRRGRWPRRRSDGRRSAGAARSPRGSGRAADRARARGAVADGAGPLERRDRVGSSR